MNEHPVEAFVSHVNAAIPTPRVTLKAAGNFERCAQLWGMY
ncbi:MAG TPA: hypothetical protein VI137_07365 [Pseudolabrys sp.]|jgi:hypothetical protein